MIFLLRRQVLDLDVVEELSYAFVRHLVDLEMFIQTSSFNVPREVYFPIFRTPKADSAAELGQTSPEYLL